MAWAIRFEFCVCFFYILINKSFVSIKNKDDDQIGQLYESIVEYFDLYEMIKVETEKRKSEPKPNTPPIFRIRGLVMRDNENKEDD